MAVGSGIGCCSADPIDPIIGIVSPGFIPTSKKPKRKDPIPQVVCWPGIPPMGLGSQLKSLKLAVRIKGLGSKNTPPIILKGVIEYVIVN